jgi:type VI secretion system protein ImpK
MDTADIARRSARKSRKKRVGDTGPIVRAGELPQRLNDAVRPCLTTIVQLQGVRRDRKPPPELAYQHVKALLTRTLQQIDALRLPPEDADHVRYALVAFIDEAMQSEAGPLRDFWQSHLLQLEQFGETRAGEGFFERLRRIQADDKNAILRVYYLCLLLGFHGMYGRQGELERENLLDDLRTRLEGPALDDVVLSPQGERPDEPGVDRERNRLLQWLAVGAASMAAVWYLGLLFTMDAQERNLSDILDRAYEDVKVGLEGSAE